MRLRRGWMVPHCAGAVGMQNECGSNPWTFRLPVGARFVDKIDVLGHPGVVSCDRIAPVAYRLDPN
jgi:hypothetical protein